MPRLLENADYLLVEDGDNRLLENDLVVASSLAAIGRHTHVGVTVADTATGESGAGTLTSSD